MVLELRLLKTWAGAIQDGPLWNGHYFIAHGIAGLELNFFPFRNNVVKIKQDAKEKEVKVLEYWQLGS